MVETPDPCVRQLKAGLVSSVASGYSLWFQSLRLVYYPTRKETVQWRTEKVKVMRLWLSIALKMNPPCRKQ